MKSKEQKHNHKPTKILKFIIFASLMLSPMFAILFKCMYVTFNSNAEQSYSGNIQASTTYIDTQTINDMKVGKWYHFDSRWFTNNVNNPSGAYAYHLNFSQFDNVETSNNIIINETENFEYINPYVSSSGILSFSGISYLGGGIIYFQDSNWISFDFVYQSNTLNYDFCKTNTIKEVNHNKYTYIDNAYYYAIEEATQSPLFNWTQNTAIYQPIQTCCSGLGMGTNTIPILLTYWILLSLIYIVFDIVIECFVFVTHLITSKVG